MQLSALPAITPFVLCSMLALAQDPGAPVSPVATPAETTSVTEAPSAGVTQPPPPQNIQPKFEIVKSGDARELAQAYVDDKKWNLGWDVDKGWGVWIGTSSLLAEDPTGLAVSLNGAQLDAKFQFAEYLAPVIATAALSTLERNPAQIKAERDRMDAEAKKEGADPVAGAVRDLLDSGSGSADANIDRRSRVSTASVTSAQAAIPGMMVAATFVKTDDTGLNGSVAIVIVSTPKSRLIANGMLKGDPIPLGTPDPTRTLRAYIDSLQPEAMVYATGATYRTNEKGELCALGFGVGSVDGDDTDDVRIAEQEALQAANAELRNVAGELIIGRRLLSRVAERTKWVDGKQTAESRKGVQTSIGSLAQGLKMPGITTVTTKRIRNAMLGDLVCVIRSWNLSSAEAAAELRQQFEQQGGWKGGEGVQPKSGSSGANGAKPAPPRPKGVPSGQGGGGIDEP